MTRLFLAAGVAALAIAAPTAAKPGGGQGGDQQAQQQQQRGGGGARAQRSGGGQRQQAVQRSGGGQRMQTQRQGGGGGQAQRMTMQRQERQQVRAQRSQQARGFERQQMRTQRQAQGRNFERQQLRSERQAQGRNFERQQMRTERQAQGRNLERQQMRAERQVQNRGLERQQMREQAQNRRFERQQVRDNRMDQRSLAREQFRDNRFERAENMVARDRVNQFRVNDDYAARYYNANRRGLIDGCPPGLWAKGNGCMPPGQAQRLLGAPLATVAGFTAVNAVPGSWGYLYPDTPDYYYRYGDGYMYQVARRTNVIASLFPLMAGGYLPGQYLPVSYMSSYVPNYYGFNSFYPDYGNICNRYGYGVVYQVDCYTGVVYDVIPLYAGGYGVGQILPTSYAYYNVPYQYRTMYYNTPDYNYWYAPGAIYQYDPGTSMITSVAALLSPGFAVGQPLPTGYGVYNVPYAYRDTYYDTSNAWYRYNNGYIYQVDPATQLVTAIVASLLV